MHYVSSVRAIVTKCYGFFVNRKKYLKVLNRSILQKKAGLGQWISDTVYCMSKNFISSLENYSKYTIK